MDVVPKKLTENPVFRSYSYYAAILILKMMLMTLLTIKQRIQNNAFVSPEDASFLRGKMSWTNQHVERVRKGHRNDMENIYLFLIIGFIYIWTEPDPEWANSLFFLFTLSRIIHTIVYTIFIVPQPARGLAWLVGYLITGYMAVKTVIYFNR